MIKLEIHFRNVCGKYSYENKSTNKLGFLVMYTVTIFDREVIFIDHDMINYKQNFVKCSLYTLI